MILEKFDSSRTESENVGGFEQRENSGVRFNHADEREERTKTREGKGVWPFGGGGGSNDDVNDDDVVALVNRGFAERAFEGGKGGMCLKTMGW